MDIEFADTSGVYPPFVFRFYYTATEATAYAETLGSKITLSGQVTFTDMTTPTDAGVRIISEADAAADQYDKAIPIPVNSDGSFSGDFIVGTTHNFTSTNTFQVVVFKNHIQEDGYHWDCGEDTYKYVGNEQPYRSWSSISVSTADYQDRSSDTCQ